MNISFAKFCFLLHLRVSIIWLENGKFNLDLAQTSIIILFCNKIEQLKVSSFKYNYSFKFGAKLARSIIIKVSKLSKI